MIISTISHTRAAQTSLAAEQRLQWLAAELESTGSIAITTAAEALGVSEMTIRRDIAELEHRGTARRVRGGATAAGPKPFGERHQIAVRAKSVIAKKLLDFVPRTGTIGLDASSTVMRLAGSLGRVEELFVLTNGPDTFSTLNEVPSVTALLTGGQLDRRTGSLTGPLAARGARQLTLDVLFCSAAGVEAAGAFEPTLDEAEVKRTMAERASLVVMAVDSSKLGAPTAALGLEWDQIDVLVTELEPSDRRLRTYRSLAQVR